MQGLRCHIDKENSLFNISNISGGFLQKERVVGSNRCQWKWIPLLGRSDKGIHFIFLFFLSKLEAYFRVFGMCWLLMSCLMPSQPSTGHSTTAKMSQQILASTDLTLLSLESFVFFCRHSGSSLSIIKHLTGKLGGRQ